MKIVFIIPRPMSLVFGGSEVQALKTKEQLEDLGHTVEFLNMTSLDQIKKADIVHFFGSDYIFGQLSEMLVAAGIPYVVSSIFYPVGSGILANKFASRVLRTQFWHRKKVLERSQRILPNSISEISRLTYMYGFDSNKFTVVNNGIDRDFIGDGGQNFRDSHIRKIFGESEFILSVGRIEGRKNSIKLLESAHRLDIPVVFIGRFTDTEKQYAHHFKNLSMRKKTGFLHINGLPQGGPMLASAYAACSAHVLLSKLETPGLVSLEAGLNGANLVVSRCAPVEDYFNDIAFIVNPEDPQDVDYAIEKAVTLPRNFLSQSEFISENYSWETAGMKTIEVYRQILEL
ncbi:glycosyltransferase family 4 protein [Deinococcus radiotolerans]|uniref:Glycosyl transferase n=1 Tax=Deinococcus radiotolerans TaxID=1309407 RepID=A0ABQ2FGV0_9DEIO|nr:glycosyltransferase family 4 protein [Deinococcus radiotolerans]GGK95168.1 glycosyl transferase [Deinococcus radiotolerans]